MVDMDRPQKEDVARDLEEKMVFVSGPRQVGKTTLARSLADRWPDLYYLNFDHPDHKQTFIRREWDRKAALVVFDEVHKWPRWKTLLKGIYDTEGIPPRLLVTGSARLDAHRRGGDSLAGRYLLHRLLPLSVAELCTSMPPAEALEGLLRLGGFPEPFLKGSETGARRWRRGYLERIVREDVRDFGNVGDLQALAMLVELLRERVGSPVSFASVARDLQVSPHTVKRWVGILESLYILFRVTPYHRNIARAILKEPKIYFYDCGLVRGDAGAVLENLVAVSLLKALCYREDTEPGRRADTFVACHLLKAAEPWTDQGHGDFGLHYIRDKEKREVDFAVVVEGKVEQLVEVKHAESNLHPALRRFAALFPDAVPVQLVQKLKRPLTAQGVQVEPAATWLSRLPL